MLSMRQSYRIIPVYTADVSGVCSALYELGGMTVMHDPSGCNSTYNTHDEIRWYNQDSLIYISGLTETDAIMGNDRKFIDDIVDATSELQPAFIALAGSPIPYMNGTDFPAIARVIENKTGIPTFSVPTNGMHDYVYGAGMALEEIARRFVKAPDCQAKRGSSCSVNILGVTPLDFGPQENVDTLKENLKAYGWNVLSTWAMGDDFETLQTSGNADVNLVVSAVFAEPYAAGDRDHSDRRAGHYGIAGSRHREKIWTHDPCTVSVKGMRIFAWQERQSGARGRGDGRGTEECEDHCSRPSVSSDLSQGQYLL